VSRRSAGGCHHHADQHDHALAHALTIRESGVVSARADGFRGESSHGSRNQRPDAQKTNVRIKSVDDAIASRPRPNKRGSPSVPTLDQLRTIREFEFVIESADPAVQAAVEAQLVNLRAQHPAFRFTARFGK